MYTTNEGHTSLNYSHLPAASWSSHAIHLGAEVTGTLFIISEFDDLFVADMAICSPDVTVFGLTTVLLTKKSVPVYLAVVVVQWSILQVDRFLNQNRLNVTSTWL